MLCLGLTGPTGSGKSMVATLFASKNIPILDADDIYHKLLVSDKFLKTDLILTFGTEIVKEGNIDRGMLGKIVFSNKEKLKKLNAITHPYVVAEIKKRLENYRTNNEKIVILDAPMLFEAGLNSICGFVVSVIASNEVRLQRIMQRDGITIEQAEKRMSAGKSIDFFKQNSDFILENNGTKEDLYLQVSSLIEKLIKK